MRGIKALAIRAALIVAFDALLVNLPVLSASVSGLLIFFSVLRVLVAICPFALTRGGSAGSWPSALGWVYSAHMPLWRCSVTALISLCAIFTFSLILSNQIPLEMNIVVILTAGPLSFGRFLRGLARSIGARGARRRVK